MKKQQKPFEWGEDGLETSDDLDEVLDGLEGLGDMDEEEIIDLDDADIVELIDELPDDGNAEEEALFGADDKLGLGELEDLGLAEDADPKMVFFFQKVDASNLQLEGIFIRDDRQPDARVAIIAEDASLVYQNDQSEVVFNIRNGSITRVGSSLENTQVVSFKAYDLKIDFEEMLGGSESGGKVRGEMSLSELNRLFHSKSSKPLYRYALEFHQRIALPLSCLFLGLVGAPLGTLFRQGNRMTGVTLGLGIFLIYYVVLSAGKGLGENGVVQPIVAIWTPNILTLALALYLWVKTERETPFKAARVLEYLKTVVAALRRISWNS